MACPFFGWAIFIIFLTINDFHGTQICKMMVDLKKH